MSDQNNKNLSIDIIIFLWYSAICIYFFNWELINVIWYGAVYFTVMALIHYYRYGKI